MNVRYQGIVQHLHGVFVKGLLYVFQPGVLGNAVNEPVSLGCLHGFLGQNRAECCQDGIDKLTLICKPIRQQLIAGVYQVGHLFKVALSLLVVLITHHRHLIKEVWHRCTHRVVHIVFFIQRGAFVLLILGSRIDCYRIVPAAICAFPLLKPQRKQILVLYSIILHQHDLIRRIHCGSRAWLLLCAGI